MMMSPTKIKAWSRFSLLGGFVLGTPISPATTSEFVR
ncbi:hypothetical protein TIFTF001_014726 [Ficus carica]|uniref:Uncharacterized protein n=1 Tax=Ficus carica TaxID=3494 RepID=A0AA88AKB4_FICCA|nr:hypothetical protein TIFTF001_014726 [Ficus carica]